MANEISYLAGKYGIPLPTPYKRPLSDGNATAVTDHVVRVDLNASNFIFSHAGDGGAGVHVYDVTAGAALPHFVEQWDADAERAVIFAKVTNIANTHEIRYGDSLSANLPSFADTFTSGTGFDAPSVNSGWGDMTQRVGGNGTATRVAKVSGPSDIRRFRIYRRHETPVLSYAMLTAAGITDGNDYRGVRECTYVIDGDNGNRITTVNGRYYITFARRSGSANDKLDAWRADGASLNGPWENFTKIYEAPTGQRLGYPSCVLKVGPTYYCYLTVGWTLGGGATPGVSVYFMTSSDMITWSSATQIVTAGIWTDQTVGGACTEAGNPWVIKCADGKYMMVVEGYGTGGKWACYGCTADTPDASLGNWTALNGGASLTGLPSSGDWDFGGYNDANPKVLQLPDNTYVMPFNGSDNNTSATADWKLGFASSPDRNTEFSKASWNPVASRSPGAYGIETSHFSYDEDGSSVVKLGQRFEEIAAYSSATAKIYRFDPVEWDGGHLYTKATTDAAYAGVLLGSSGSFVAESVTDLTAQRPDGATPILLGIMDHASVPAAGANAGFARRIEIDRGSHEHATPGGLLINYWNTGGTRQFWTGSAWSTSATYIDTDLSRPIRARITHNGTTYQIHAFYADDETQIAATAAFSDVQSFSSGDRLLACGVPFTDAWICPMYLRQVSVRPYAATEPAIAVGSESPL